MKPKIDANDLLRASVALAVPKAAIQAVCSVEAPGGGFDSSGEPIILFEGHKFSALTGGRYDASHPTISYPKWTRQFYSKGATSDIRNAGEHARLAEAVALDRDAALQSASWGKFQTMGSNYKAAGFVTLQGFINAMYTGEGQHLDAFVSFVKQDRGGQTWKALQNAVSLGAWGPFASLYNGPAYRDNNYDTKLAAAYKAAA